MLEDWPLSKQPENAHLLRKRKYHCTVLLVWLQLLCYVTIMCIFTCLVETKAVNEEVSSTVILPHYEVREHFLKQLFQNSQWARKFTNCFKVHMNSSANLQRLISDHCAIYNFCFYCSATHMTPQVLQPKLLNKRYRGCHTFISLYSALICQQFTKISGQT